MNRTLLALGTLIFCFSIQTVSLAKTNKKKPNIVFILVDDLGWRDLACYGSDYYETPNVDAFAKTGISFSNAYTASPLCSPTRASILTGQEPGRLRFTTPAGHKKKVVLDPKETHSAAPHFKAAPPQTCTRLKNEYVTFAEVLKENGYTTAFMGKWHLGHEPYIPENQGFDVVVGGRAHPGPPPPGHFFAPWNINTMPKVSDGSHICDVLTDQAINYIEKNKDNQFLLCLWYYDVHAPFQAKEELVNKYRAKLYPGQIQRCPTMGAMIETMDTNVGRVLKTIKDMELEDETIVIFTSDNGGNMYDSPDGTNPTNNYPLRAGKGCNYEGGVRVPLIVRVPGVTEAGGKSEVITSTVDHYATILELLDIPFPKDVVHDGYSFVKALKGKNYERKPIYSHFCHNTPATGNRPNVSMRQGPWRFYKFYFDGPNLEHRYELYNLDEDISEKNNLASQMPDKVKKMEKMLDEHTIEAGYLLANKNKNFQGNGLGPWLGSSGTKLSNSNGVLKMESTNSEPFVETYFKPNLKDRTYKLEFEMKSDSKGEGFLSWKSRGDNEYSSENSSDINPVHDGRWHKYVVELRIGKLLRVIKIQPSSDKGNIEIKNIKLLTGDNHILRDWPLM